VKRLLTALLISPFVVVAVAWCVLGHVVEKRR